MARWYELAVPALSALLGVAVATFSQQLLTRSQRKHDRTMRILDEKVRDYRSVLRDLVGLPEIVVRLRTIHEGLNSSANELAELDNRNSVLQKSLHGAAGKKLAELFDQHAAIGSRKTELHNTRTILHAEQKALFEKMRHLRIQLGDLRLWSPAEVIEVSAALVHALDSEEPTEKVNALARRVEAALRCDLLEA